MKLSMEYELIKYFSSAGVVGDTVKVLEQEAIYTGSIFLAFTDDHFMTLLLKMKVGQHALLMPLLECHKQVSFIIYVCASCEGL